MHGGTGGEREEVVVAEVRIIISLASFGGTSLCWPSSIASCPSACFIPRQGYYTCVDPDSSGGRSLTCVLLDGEDRRPRQHRCCLAPWMR